MRSITCRGRLFARARPGRFAVLLAVVFTGLLCLVDPVTSFYVRRISGQMPSYASVDSYDFRISPDGAWVAFAADIETDEVENLYLAPITGGRRTRLTNHGTAHAEIYNINFSPDSRTVVYLTGRSGGEDDLYSAPISGGPPVNLDAALPHGADRDVLDYEIAPNGSRVVFLFRQATSEVALYSAPIAGGTAIRLSQDMAAGGRVDYDFAITPNSSYVVFRANAGGTDQFEIFYTPIGARNVRRLNGTLPAGGSVTSFALMPNSSGVIYEANHVTVNIENLYRSNFYTTPDPNPVNLTVVEDSGMMVYDPPQITPDGSYVIYPGSHLDAYQSELFCARTNAPGTYRISPSAMIGEHRIDRFRITPNGLGVVFVVQVGDDGIYNRQLFSNYASLPAQTPLRLSPVLAGTDKGVSDYLITPNSAGVVFKGDLNDDEQMELFGTLITGGTRYTLSEIPPGGDVYEFALSNNVAVVYTATQDSLTRKELYTSLLNGSGSARISAPILAAGGNVTTFRMAPNGVQVVYRADAEQDEKFELYMVEDTEPFYAPFITK